MEGISLIICLFTSGLFYLCLLLLFLLLLLLLLLLLQVLPVPMPLGSSKSGPRCFWGSASIGRSTQVECLRLLLAATRHFVCCCFSLPSCRLLDAQRLLVAAAACCIADRVLRLAAVDAPSPVSLIYSGKEPGVGGPFAVSLEGLNSETTFILLSDPEAATARTQVSSKLSPCP